MKFEYRCHEETERQQRCARSKAWNLAENTNKLKEKDNKAAFYFPAEEWVLPAASTKEPEERGFVVDSGASMHMVSEKDLKSAELDTIRTSRSPMTVMTANGEVRTNKERGDDTSQDFFVKVTPLQETPQFFPWRSSVRIMGIHHWTSGQKPHLIRNGKRSDCNISNYVPFVVHGLSASSSSTIHFHHHLHHRILYMMSPPPPRVSTRRRVRVRGYLVHARYALVLFFSDGVGGLFVC